MGLEAYNQKRDFDQTLEPTGKLSRQEKRRFVVQEHHASRLHFDFRLEMGGVLKSWAVPKGPSLDPQQKRLAVMTEDHPVEYLHFEGHIAEGNYGAGDMVIWDHGRYGCDGDPVQSVAAGRLRFHLRGEKLRGAWTLLRMKRDDKQWLLVKADDEFADPDWELKTILPVKASEKAPAKHDQPRRYTATKAKSRAGTKTDDKAISAATAFRKKELTGDVTVEVENHQVALTSLDKLYWPDEDYTKGDLLRYYFQIADTILPYLRDRALILKRYPNGIKGHSFFQHNVEDPPEFVSTLTEEVEGDIIHYAVCDNVASLLYIANLGTIAQNPWHSRVGNLDHPDWIVFDLDPEGEDFGMVCEVALTVKEMLESLGLESYPKTSGSSGMHVYVPVEAVYSYDQAAHFAERIGSLVQKARRDLVTLERSLKKRKAGLVYFDHLQNAQGKTVVSPYS
ncbi:MAG: hypothetical protein M3347_07030, partial [Armatimonadota bacterium]|nr:hypothetical protein [Armatimonadota bacterium]